MIIFCSNRGETRFLFSVVEANSGNHFIVQVPRKIKFFIPYIINVYFQSADMELTALLDMLYEPEYALHRFADQLEVELDVLDEKGVDGLLDLFDGLRRLMEPKDHSLSLPALNRNSVLGLYVRRMLIFFEKLAFDQVVTLYNDLKKYIERKVSNPENSDISVISKKEDLGPHK